MSDAIHEGARRTAAGASKQGRTEAGRSPRAGHVAGSLKTKPAAVAVTRTGGVHVDPVYRNYFSASPEERIVRIRNGVAASEAKRIIRDLGVEQGVFFEALGLKTATVNRKAKRNDPLTSDESERLLGVARLVGQVEAMVAESGDSDGFDAAGWMADWLRQPLPALGGVEPMDRGASS